MKLRRWPDSKPMLGQHNNHVSWKGGGGKNINPLSVLTFLFVLQKEQFVSEMKIKFAIFTQLKLNGSEVK